MAVESRSAIAKPGKEFIRPSLDPQRKEGIMIMMMKNPKNLFEHDGWWYELIRDKEGHVVDLLEAGRYCEGGVLDAFLPAFMAVVITERRAK